MRINTTLPTILERIKSRLKNPWPDTSIYISDIPDLEHHTHDDDTFLVIKPNVFDNINPEITLYSGSIDIIAYMRLSLDDANRSDSLLIDDTWGLLRWCDKVVSKLDTCDLTDEDDNNILAQPIRLKSQSATVREGHTSWSSCTITFDVMFGFEGVLGAFDNEFSFAYEVL